MYKQFFLFLYKIICTYIYLIISIYLIRAGVHVRKYFNKQKFFFIFYKKIVYFYKKLCYYIKNKTYWGILNGKKSRKK